MAMELIRKKLTVSDKVKIIQEMEKNLCHEMKL
jgi:hypothetical protein